MSTDVDHPGPGPARRHVPTLEEVAELAGVSRSTASRAINGGLRVSPRAQEAVNRAIASLGYSPNRAARSLVTRRTDSIALVIPEPDDRVLSDPFFSGTLHGLAGALSGSEIQLVLLIARPGENTPRTVRYLRNGHVDGAVVVSHHRADELDAELVGSGVPHVFIGRPWHARDRHLYVDADNVRGARLATEHLLTTGRRRIGTVCGPQDMSPGVDRFTGWQGALAEHGLPTDAVEQGDFTTEGGARATAALLDRFPDLDAVFVASDLMAAGAIGALAARGLAVPGDVAVVGYDNLGLAASTTPALTTVTNPVVAMARAAGQLLLSQLADPDGADEPVIFEPELVVRASA